MADPLFPDYAKSWTAAVDAGMIDGDPAYYYTGQAGEHEYYHALLVAILEAHGVDWNPDTPPPPPPPPPDPEVDVTVGPGTWQTITSQPAGAAIGLTAGTYNGFSVTPKTGQRFIVMPGAAVTLDGQGAAFAFQASKVGGVIIDGRAGTLHITNYQGPFFRGVINNLLVGDWYSDGNTKPDTWLKNGWKVHGVRITNCGTHGVTLCGDGAQLTDFTIEGHPTGRRLEIGWKMLYGHDQLVADGEVSGCRPTNWGNEGGGSKNWNTIGLIVERVKSHGHDGPGIWHDWNNWKSTVRDCEVWDCTGPGIFQEIAVESQIVGDDVGVSVIENNLVHDMRNSERWGGVEVATSGPVIVRNNTIRNSKAGIWFRDQSRPPWQGGTSGQAKGNVLDNAGKSGYIKESGQGGVVTWGGNTYMNGSSGPN